MQHLGRLHFVLLYYIDLSIFVRNNLNLYKISMSSIGNKIICRFYWKIMVSDYLMIVVVIKLLSET